MYGPPQSFLGCTNGVSFNLFSFDFCRALVSMPAYGLAKLRLHDLGYEAVRHMDFWEAKRMSETHPAELNHARTPQADVPFERLFDAAPTLVSVYQGPDHVCLYRNPSQDRAHRHRPLLGLKLRDAVPEYGSTGLFTHLDQVFAQGQSVELAEVEISFDHDPAENRRRFLRFSLQPWYDANGAIAGVMSFGFDITEQVEARRHAEASERHLAFALEISRALGVFNWDTEKTAFKVDTRFLEGFGLDPSSLPETLAVQRFLANIHLDDRDRVASAINQAIATGEDYEARYRIVTPEGHDRHVLAKGRCSQGVGGKVDQFAGVVLDITKQHQDEQALRESEARLRSVFSSIDQGYCVAEMVLNDAGKPIDYRFIEVNPQFEEMTGLKDATGRRALELVPNLETKWIEIYAGVALGGKAIRFEEGSKVMGRWFDVFATAVEPRGRFALVFRDITLKKTMQEALLKREAEFRTMTEAMPQMVWATRPDGRHDFFNIGWYEFTGVPLGATDGEQWSDLFHAEDREAAEARWLQSLATGEPYEVEFRLRHHSGQYRWTLGRAHPVRDCDGEILRWLGTCTDIHDLKIAGEQRQLLLDEMNNRIKNTLAIVNVMVSQTLRRADDPQAASAALQARIHMLAKAHDRLVNDKWTQTHIAQVVEMAIAPHRTGENRFAFDGPDLVIGPKQAVALTLALHELATNAAKYGALSAEKGDVFIGWSKNSTDAGEIFHFTWVEAGGPPVTAPTQRGFGSRMIEQALAGYFKGHAELLFEPRGLQFKLTAPLSGLSA